MAMKKNNVSSRRARLEEVYVTKIRPSLKQNLKLENIMQVPKVSKIVINVGAKEAVADSKVLQTVVGVTRAISGQEPVKTEARKSIAGFKIREGMQIGAMVTLRGKPMYEFLDKLINLALPKVRDFQGVPTRFDGRGGYNLGIKEWNIFPEAEAAGASDKLHGMNITIQTTATQDEHAFELLKSFGMPFRVSKQG
jgi:large subunit ribosomal protein L5